MRVLYVPVDERPCNTHIVERIANSTPDIQLLIPPKKYLGYKKTPSDSEGIWQWINNHVANVDAIILSVDMLIYGGLLPSRLHYLTFDKVQMWFNRFRELRRKNPNILIYAFNVLMRNPSYSSSDEEPDYYEEWGREIFLQAYLKDKLSQTRLSEYEMKQLEAINKNLPNKYVDDYRNRREFNLMVNKNILKLVSEGIFSLLVIPQDDSAEYGYTATDQREILHNRDKMGLVQQVLNYPGADEVGATLLARVHNTLQENRPKIYTLWSNPDGAHMIPMYEDRSFEASLKAHINAAGCQQVTDHKVTDLILAYNIPKHKMEEAVVQSNNELNHDDLNDMQLFVDKIRRFIEQGKRVIVADSSYANGGDKSLINLLDREKVLDKIQSYKAWNTNCNTLGSTISQGVIGFNGQPEKIKENIVYHLLDDYFYQTEIRKELVEEHLPQYKLNYFDLKDKAEIVNKLRDNLLQKSFNDKLDNSFKGMSFSDFSTYSPWNRLFECGINLKVTFY